MASNLIPIELSITRFYLKGNNSKRFLALSEEDLEKLSKRIYIEQDEIAETQSRILGGLSKLERYQKTLQYLTNPHIHLDLKTFDERAAYLIMSLDPNLVIFKEFLKLDLISIADISKVEDEDERNRLNKIRNQTILAYESVVREKIGFFDAKLLKYEEMFFKRFFNERELITEVGCNNQDRLMIKAKALKDFNSISDERYEELVDVAQTWLSLAPERYNSKVAAYSVTNQNKLLGLKNSAEQLALFILLIDSDLDMLRIYEEESMMGVIKERITEQFGYFNTELLVLERKFHDRFYPDKQISIWSKVKKD